MLCLIVSATCMGYAQMEGTISAVDGLRGLLRTVAQEPDSIVRDHLINVYLRELESEGNPVVSDSVACLLYYGDASTVTVPGDLNGWDPGADTMLRVPGTRLFTLWKTLDPPSRWEYKIRVDALWILDPINPHTELEGFGLNSEVRMPSYVPPQEIEPRKDVHHGTIDTLMFSSSVLGITHPVLVYRPYVAEQRVEPSIYVLDGGQYLQLGRMATVLDNLIADERIPPVVAIFVDPRTDLEVDSTNRRMSEYALSRPFLTFLSSELRPALLRKYNLDESPDRTAILGASLGALEATFASFLLPGTFGLCAAQSPAYHWEKKEIIHLFARSQAKGIKFSIDTGTLGDAEKLAREMHNVLRAKGYHVHYAEYPEGHNWANWRARLDDILIYFFASEHLQ